MSEYTPTTDEARQYFVDGVPIHMASDDDANGYFFRWLAVHDAEVAAKTLEDAARVWDKEGGRIGTAISVITWLRARAKRIQGTK